MKILFLDIDGVLNSEIWFTETRKNNPHLYNFERHELSHFDPISIARLNHITDSTGAKIVVSSIWRKSRKLVDLQLLFKEVYITGEVIDKTPQMRIISSTQQSIPRGCEIKEWLILNKVLLGQEPHVFNKFAILDDDSDMLFNQKDNYFRVDPYAGLTANIAYRVINFLNAR